MYGLPNNVYVVHVIQCVSRCSVHRFYLCLCMSEAISSFKSLREGSQVFALPVLLLCMILHNMWSGKSLQLLCILPFRILCFVCHQNYAYSNSIGSVYVGGYCGLSESELCVFGKLCPVGHLVVCKCLSVLLQSIVMSHVDYGDDG